MWGVKTCAGFTDTRGEEVEVQDLGEPADVILDHSLILILELRNWTKLSVALHQSCLSHFRFLDNV